MLDSLSSVTLRSSNVLLLSFWVSTSISHAPLSPRPFRSEGSKILSHSRLCTEYAAARIMTSRKLVTKGRFGCLRLHVCLVDLVQLAAKVRLVDPTLMAEA